MATSYTTTGINVKIKLNNGTSATGQVKTVSVNLGGSSQKINVTAYTTDLNSSRDTVIALTTALAPLFSKSIYRVAEITEGEIEG